ncbi:MAG TPA: autotransporter-associated beta strand repeat-containing protein, partial [Tepidisphaeraceae bacterium]|nr:autotransporter-associated beta strand repeat-containing protein [Tepidisphaeraceae bacterium]
MHRCRRKSRAALLLAVGSLSFAVTTKAQVSYFWQGEPTSTHGGSGSWETTNTEWSSLGSSGAADHVWQNDGLERANFGITPGTVNISVPFVVVNGMNFNTGGYIITGAGTISWAGGNVNIGNGNTGTISTQIGGAGTFTKIGLGTVVLDGNNNFTNGLTASVGTLILNGNNSFSGGLTVTGGTVSLTNANTFTGGMSISGGGTVIGMAQASGSPFGDTTAPVSLDTSVLRLTGIAANTVTTIGDLTIAGQSFSGTGASNVIIDNTAGNGGGFTTTLAAGNLIRGGQGAVLAITPESATLGAGAQVTFSNGNSLLTNGMLPAWIVGATPNVDFLTHDGNGVATVTYTSTDLTTSTSSDIVNQSSAPTITGNVNAYALKTNQAINLDNNVLTLGNGSGQTGLILNSGGSITNGTVNFGNTEGMVYLQGTTTLGSTGKNIVSNGLTITASGLSNLTLAGKVVNGSAATKLIINEATSGSGLAMSDANSYTGGTALNVNTGSTGTVSIGNDTAFGSGKVSVTVSTPQLLASGG